MACDCCVCIGGVNYTKSCSACCTAMSASSPNPSNSQAVCKAGCGGAGNLSVALNAIGKWGTAITGLATGRRTVVTPSGVAVGQRGANVRMNGGSLLLVLIVVLAIAFLATRK